MGGMGWGDGLGGEGADSLTGETAAVLGTS